MAQLSPPPGGSGSLTQQPPGGPTQPRGASYQFRVLGPCFDCLEMGHLKANCPKLARLYPLSIVVANAVTVASDKTDNISSSNVISSSDNVSPVCVWRIACQMTTSCVESGNQSRVLHR